MYKFSFIIFLLISTFCINAQEEIDWDLLSDVKFKNNFVKAEDAFFAFPNFGEKVRAFEGKKVEISGYIIPVDEELCVLSRFGYASCFFCGQAGPETVLELQFEGDTRDFEMDEFSHFQGILELNDADIYHCKYILKNAVEVEKY